MRRHRNSKPAFRDQKLEPGHLPKSFYRSQGCEKRADVFDRSQGDGHHHHHHTSSYTSRTQIFRVSTQ